MFVMPSYLDTLHSISYHGDLHPPCLYGSRARIFQLGQLGDGKDLNGLFLGLIESEGPIEIYWV